MVLARPSDLARFWGLHPKTVTEWIRAGRITAVRTPGGQRRIHPNEVRAFCDREARELPPFAREDQARLITAGLSGAALRALKAHVGTSFTIASHAKTIDAVVDAVKAPPALFVIDARAEDADAADAIRALRRESPSLAILAIDSPSARRTAELQRAGASEVLARVRPRGALADAIRTLVMPR